MKLTFKTVLTVFLALTGLTACTKSTTETSPRTLSDELRKIYTDRHAGGKMPGFWVVPEAARVMADIIDSKDVCNQIVKKGGSGAVTVTTYPLVNIDGTGNMSECRLPRGAYRDFECDYMGQTIELATGAVSGPGTTCAMTAALDGDILYVTGSCDGKAYLPVSESSYHQYIDKATECAKKAGSN